MADEKNTSDAPSKSIFAEVKRQAKERRADSDRRSAARRASEMQDIARQLAQRQAAERKPVEAAAPNDDEATEAIKDDPA